jgi:hypothetical protein
MKKILLLFSMAAMILSGCSTDTSTGPTDDMIVVRGYVYANEPVWDIQITKTLALGSVDSTAPPINDASVIITKGDDFYKLTPSDGDSGYYFYDGDDLIIQAGETIGIKVTYGEHEVSGKTSVPQPPTGLALDKTYVSVPTFSGGFPGAGGVDREAMELTVTWDEDSEALFYVVVENVEENPVDIASGFPGRGGMNRRFVFPPTNRNDYRINAMQMTQYGKHIVKVYRVNQEYADLYGSRQQDSRELNEPLTNIDGGLGIFSAFNSASSYFTVTASE